MPTLRWLDRTTVTLGFAMVALLVIGGRGQPSTTDATAPPAGRAAHGAAGSARNGFGGEIAPSPSIASWPGTANGGNGGPFAFIGAHYGPLWGIPPGPNNSQGVGYCVMEDVTGEGDDRPPARPGAVGRRRDGASGGTDVDVRRRPGGAVRDHGGRCVRGDERRVATARAVRRRRTHPPPARGGELRRQDAPRRRQPEWCRGRAQARSRHRGRQRHRWRVRSPPQRLCRGPAARRHRRGAARHRRAARAHRLADPRRLAAIGRRRDATASSTWRSTSPTAVASPSASSP